jgi:hypothetical protein
MSVLNPLEPTVERRRSRRLVAAGTAAGVAVLYLVLFLVLLPHLHETDNPAPAFAALAVVYLVGTWLLARRDARWVQVVGAVLQALLVAGYVWLFASSADAGDDQFFVDHLAFGLVITAAQLALLVLLVLLARTGGAPTVEGHEDAPG